MRHWIEEILDVAEFDGNEVKKELDLPVVYIVYYIMNRILFNILYTI